MDGDLPQEDEDAVGLVPKRTATPSPLVSVGLLALMLLSALVLG